MGLGSQCYLSHNTAERAPPKPQPGRSVLGLPTPEGQKAELIQLDMWASLRCGDWMDGCVQRCSVSRWHRSCVARSGTMSAACPTCSVRPTKHRRKLCWRRSCPSSPSVVVTTSDSLRVPLPSHGAPTLPLERVYFIRAEISVWVRASIGNR